MRGRERKQEDEERITRTSEVERPTAMEQGWEGERNEGIVLYSEWNIEN